jgi:chitin synthase
MHHQPDEAQRGRYNDGYNPNPNPSLDFASPYDAQPYHAQPPYGSLPDPFSTPQSYQTLVAHDPYGAPQPEYLNSQYTLQGHPTQSTPHLGQSYELHDDAENEIGDIPLLRRDRSQGSIRPVPGAYDDQDEPETNIRYGRIPQRVPRRYKTVKKVE